MYLGIYTYMLVPTTDEKEELHLKESKDVCMGGLRGRKGKGEMR